jgi:hypothetical protein
VFHGGFYELLVPTSNPELSLLDREERGEDQNMHHFEIAFEKSGGKKNTLPPQVLLLVSRGSERHQTIPILDVIFEKQASGHTFALGYKLFVFGVGGREDKEERRQKEDGHLIRITSGTRDGSSSTTSMLSENYTCG